MNWKKITIDMLILLFLFMGISFSAHSAEPPCRERILSICQEDQDAMICRLLSYNKPETPGSITAFLSKIGKLDSGIQQELICARLMGKKKIVDLDTTLSSSTEAVFKAGIGTFKFTIHDPDYAEVISAHKKLQKFKLCPSAAISFDISGMVMDVDAEYDNSSDTLKSFVFTMDDVVFSNIKTIYAEGGFDVQRKPLEKRIDEEYLKYFNSGSKPGKESIMENKPQPSMISKNDLKAYTNSIGMEFVLIPAKKHLSDKFSCGNKNIIHGPFYIGKYEVTQGQWETIMGENPSRFKDCGKNCPVENVSWNDAQAFIRKLNQKEGKTYRLPTEAEWEYACRAGTTTAYCFGDKESLLDQYAWYDQNSGKKTHPVGQKKPNSWGLYDMHGNVWEWCQDYYDGSCTLRVVRGGSWYNGARDCRSAYRSSLDPGNRNYGMGFRLAFSPGQQ